MSATTEFVILQAAAAPPSAKSASELGLPSDQTAKGEFADTLKAELTSGQRADKTGKSLPQGGEKSPKAPSEIDSAEPAPEHGVCQWRWCGRVRVRVRVCYRRR